MSKRWMSEADLDKIATREGYRVRDSKKGAAVPKKNVLARADAKNVPAHTFGQMNATEAAYARMLDDRVKRGVIRGWSFERLTLTLAFAGAGIKSVKYTPDFMLIRNDGSFELVEIKGGFVRQSGINKFKQARDRFRCFHWTFAQYRNHEWEEKTLERD